MALGRRLRSGLIVAVVALSATVLAAPGRGAASATNTPIAVNSTADPGDGTCDVTECTLHEAIAKANAAAGADEVDFAISGPGVHTIALVGELPAITGQLTIDGYSQGGASSTDHLIEISGQNAARAPTA
jgi:CSLREA domain-containing protein